MPAVNPTRLRFQIEGLLSFFESPSEFHLRLRDFFNNYGDHTLRFGEYAPTQPQLPMYHLPDPVTRQLEFELRQRITTNPQVALALADELWQDDTFEIKQLAIFILGHTPLEDSQRIYQRLENWLTPGMDTTLSVYLFSEGTKELLITFPEAWESFVKSYLDHQNPKMVNLGLQGLAEGLKQSSFQNMPAVFRLVSPFMRDPKSENMRALENLIGVLAKLSPNETVFFLKQTLSLTSNIPLTTRLIKSSISLLPDNLQNDLKATLKK